MKSRSVAVVPIREPENTKLRLSKLLSGEQRASLSRAILVRVLNAVEESKIEEAVVVASSPQNLSEQRERFPKTTFIRESSHHGGVNCAMRDGMNYLLDKNGSSIQKTVLIPSDLPILQGKHLNNVLALLENFDTLINPSAKLDGTALLAFRENKSIPLHYDDDSFNKHLAELEKSGRLYRILRWKAFSFDVDDEDDLRKLIRIYKSRSLSGLLQKLNSK